MISKTLLLNILGWIPAIVFPLATTLQLIKIAQAKTAQGVSINAWLLFGLANVGFYAFSEKYFAIQSIMALLLTAILDFVIVGMVLVFRWKTKR